MFEKVVLALDGSARAHKALEATAELAAKTGCEVRVVHVREHGFAGHGAENETEGRAAAHQLVDEALDTLRARGITAEGAVKGSSEGRVAQAILDEAAAAGADVVVVGSHGHSELAELLVGSTTQRLLHLSTMPVLVVR